VQQVEDEQAIKRLLVEYAVRLDAKDIEGYLNLFAEEGVWQIGTSVRKGYREIKAMLEGMYGETTIEPMGYERYRIITNMQVNLEGDRATARSRHLTLMRGEKGNPMPTLGGLYEDVLIRENGEWKILHRIDHPIMPTAEEWSQQMTEMLARERD